MSIDSIKIEHRIRNKNRLKKYVHYYATFLSALHADNAYKYTLNSSCTKRHYLEFFVISNYIEILLNCTITLNGVLLSLYF